MKRIVIWLLSTVTVVVLLFGYRTSTQGALTGSGESVISSGTDPGTSSTAGEDGSTSGGSTGSDGSSGSGSTGSGSTGSSSGSSSGSSKTVTGSTIQTRWGPVQVQVTVKNGKITKATALQYPDNNRKDQEINSYAIPILIDETISAQSANIDMVGGATVTSEGYIQSLQSALDQAGL